jgi:HAMP domain-containing protein
MLDSRPGLSDTAAEPEPTSETESVRETAARRLAASAPAPEVIERRVVETVQRRHFHFWQQFLGVMTGALIGSLLTLLLLYFFNGTLRFAGESRVQLQLDEETSAIRQSQSLMTDEIGELAGRVAELDNELATSEEAIGAVEEDVSGLEDETAALSERLETIDLAAEKFDNFLIGLRDLLVAIQGLPPVPTATVTISGTATISATISGTVTPEGTAATMTPTPTATGPTPEGGVPTRTPRPTATPLIETQN